MKKITHSLVLTLLTILLVSCVGTGELQISDKTHDAEVNIVLASEVEWTYLNPARKDKAPMAGTLWGDRKGTEATGFLLKPTDGFSSPPHIHNVSYRGLVISGLIHNDDPNAANMWMPAGSFWTQPKGEVHITSAKGVSTLAYIEIEEGPYLVLPAEEEFDSGERPVNVDHSNVVWVDAESINWIESASKKKASVAFLWGELETDQLRGTLLKLPVGFNGQLISESSRFGAVLIQGQLEHHTKVTQSVILDQGSYLSSKGKAIHKIKNTSGQESILYIRSDQDYSLKSKAK